MGHVSFARKRFVCTRERERFIQMGHDEDLSLRDLIWLSFFLICSSSIWISRHWTREWSLEWRKVRDDRSDILNEQWRIMKMMKKLFTDLWSNSCFELFFFLEKKMEGWKMMKVNFKFRDIEDEYSREKRELNIKKLFRLAK